MANYVNITESNTPRDRYEMIVCFIVYMTIKLAYRKKW